MKDLKQKGAGIRKKEHPGVYRVKTRLTGFRRGVINKGKKLIDAGRDATVSERARQMLLLSAVFVASVFMSLGELPFECYPVGIALICAVNGKIRILPGLSAGLFASALIAGSLLSCLFVKSYPFVHFAVYACAFIIRMVMTGGALDESPIASTAVCAFTASLCALIIAAFEGFSLPSLFMLLTLSVLSPMICYVLGGFYGEKEQFFNRECAFLAFVTILVYSLREPQILGVAPAFAGSVVFTFAVARFRGPIYGAVAGLAVGLACGTSLYGALLGLSGFFAGLFFPVSSLLALCVGFVVSAGFSIFGAGFSGFGAVADDYVAGMALWFVFRRFFDTVSEKNGSLVSRSVGEGEALKDPRLEKLSDAFHSLSRVFYTVSDSMRVPDVTQTTAVVSDCCSRLCSGCRAAGDCWGREYSSTRDASFRLAQALLGRGSVGEDDLSAHFRKKCFKHSELIASVNESFSKLCSDCFRDNRTDILAGEYSTVARLLKSSAAGEDADASGCETEKRKAARLLKRLGVSFVRVEVGGKRELKIDVYGVAPQAVSLSSERLKGEFEKEFGCLFDDPAFLLLESTAVLRMKKKRKLVLECAKACRAKNGENVNGDTTGFFESDSDRFYSMICDGMGSGRDAAITSRLAELFIEKLLSCSSPDGLTFEMLNSFLLARNEESFTTVDLLEVDLLSGEGSFIKAGAAPSFVVRKDNVFRVASRTPPAGILPKLTAEKTALDLMAGDVIVMVSDGVCPDSGGEWFLSKLAGADAREPSELASALLNAAAERGKGADDMTVFVISVKAA
ncbi:MAG: SpoIIE family protein phosphatase [Clostridia bacterium]|nr:SpoIIE family protein phosphatase [Clostridia bacterium]